MPEKKQLKSERWGSHGGKSEQADFHSQSGHREWTGSEIRFKIPKPTYSGPLPPSKLRLLKAPQQHRPLVIRYKNHVSQWEGHLTFKPQSPNERFSWRERLKARRSGTHSIHRVKNSVSPPIQGRPGFPEPNAPSKDALRLAIIHHVIDRPTVHCVSARSDNIHSLEDVCDSFPGKQ